jgi:D-glycero-alpha-D-manno-heptose-7-phosphate kinase
MKTIRSRAPLRISFAGGGTDVEPYLSEHGGQVLSCSISRYAYASMTLTSTPGVMLRSLDYDVETPYRAGEAIDTSAVLALVKGVLHRLEVGSSDDEPGFELLLHSDARPGSGLGSSSTLVVALIGLFKHWLHLPYSDYEVADLAYQIERKDLQIVGGKQDQYAATFGGFNLIEFTRDTTIVNPLRIGSGALNELQYNLLLCQVGERKSATGIIESQVEACETRQEDVMRAMAELKEIARSLKNALLRGRIRDFGSLLNDAWLAKKRLAADITTPGIDDIYQAARDAGALGGKISGAGGGGHMFFYCDHGARHRVAEALARHGAQMVDFTFDFRGLQSWTAA